MRPVSYAVLNSATNLAQTNSLHTHEPLLICSLGLQDYKISCISGRTHIWRYRYNMRVPLNDDVNKENQEKKIYM